MGLAGTTKQKFSTQWEFSKKYQWVRADVFDPWGPVRGCSTYLGDRIPSITRTDRTAGPAEGRSERSEDLD